MPKTLAIIDCPINVFTLRCLLRDDDDVDFIVALPDHLPTDYDYYLSDFFNKSNSIRKFYYSHPDFWSDRSNVTQRSAKKLLQDYELEKYEMIFCNSSTNPFSITVKNMKTFEHLYHSPSDFIELFPTIFIPGKSLYKRLKSIIKNIYLHHRVTSKPIYSPLALKIPNKFVNFKGVNASLYSQDLKQCMDLWDKCISISKKNILMLLSGEEPRAGKVSSSRIEKYLKSHSQGIIELSKYLDITQHTIYIKEHKSYDALSREEKHLICLELERFVDKVEFVSEILPSYYRNLPGEMLCNQGNIEIIIGEPSSLIFNVTGYVPDCYAIVGPFDEVRDPEQMDRNRMFMKMNKILKNPVAEI